jgi:hypothetical protein
LKQLGGLFLIISAGSMPASAQMTFNDLTSYCKVASEVSTPTLMARTQNMTRSQVEALVEGMTDPVAIGMAREVIAYAFSRPAGTPIEQLRAEVNERCLARKIFVYR